MLIMGVDFGLVWMSLSVINKSFVLFFCGTSLYTFSLSLHALFVLYSGKRQRWRQNTSNSGPPLGILHSRFENLRQLHIFTLYLFGFCIAMQVPSVFHTIDHSKEYPLNATIRGLTFLFYFDAIVFLGFLLLHAVQWIVSARLDSFWPARLSDYHRSR